MTLADLGPQRLVARVVPDVTGLDKEFDYLVPDSLLQRVEVGDRVRVPLHGRRVGGWVVALSPHTVVDRSRLVPIAAWSSRGPSESLIALATWAATRWGAPRIRPFLVQASPDNNVATVPVAHRTVTAAASTAQGVRVRCTAPLTDPLPEVLDIVRRGPAIVVHPSPAAAKAVASRLRRAGVSVALMPDDWAAAAGGVDVVVGSRGAVWAPCPGLAAIVVLDEHDESLQDERTPTWHARDVAIERCRREGAECVLMSPCPTASALVAAGSNVVRPTATEAARSWPFIDVVDRSAEPPWSRSLVSSRLIDALRDHQRRVVCVLNTAGRARLLACRGCRALQRCTSCDAAVRQDDDGQLHCNRCGASRPPVCQQCGSSAMANVRPGVTRLRDELEAAANRPVCAVTGTTDSVAPDANVFVGTEAVLHRVRDIDTVCFLDADAELLAPRYRAAEQFSALVVRAARLVGSRERGGVVMVQTHVPDHPVVHALQRGELHRLWPDELARRRLFRLPPFGALAALEGQGAGELAAATGLEIAPLGADRGVLLRADDWMVLGEALAVAPRPKGSRLRIEVDPPRA